MRDNWADSLVSFSNRTVLSLLLISHSSTHVFVLLWARFILVSLCYGRPGRVFTAFVKTLALSQFRVFGVAVTLLVSG